MVNQGFSILVGAHTWDKSVKSNIQRFDRVTKSFPVMSEVTSIANPFGGGIYIVVPYKANLGIVTVQIANAVQSPFFSATSFHQTTLQEWTDTERHHPGPWADFESDKFMMQVPTSWIYNYADPVTQMQDWDLAMDGFSELLGFPLVRNRTVLYVQPDINIAHGAYGIGYPQVNNIYNPNAGTNGNSSHYFLTDPIGWSTTYHELGHAQLFSKFPGHTESMVNLPYVYIATEKFGVGLVEAFTKSMVLGYLENISVDQAALTWFVTENFRNGNPMDITNSEYNEVRYQHRGYGRYVEIAVLFGWDVLSDFYYQEHLDYMSGAPGDGLDYTDSRILRLSKAAGVDLTPLIHCWGVHPVNPGALQAAIATEGLPPSKAIYDRLVHYKDIIPANNTEFWDHYLTIYPTQPEGGNPLYQYGWYNVWKYIYDEIHGTAAKNAMQDIIDLYYQSTPMTISGNVGLKGVIMSGLPGNPVSSEGGIYSGVVYEGWSGTVTPTLAGYLFTPASITYTDVTSDQLNQDYTAHSLIGDINLDGRINLVDFAWLSANWLEIGCDGGNSFCSGADIDQMGDVGLDDLLILAEHWLEEKRLPSQASNPHPADGATGVSTTADLSWTGAFAESHDVYFGTSSPGTFQGNQTLATFDPGPMAPSTTYYWRIDGVNAWGKTTGTVWSFTTGSGPPPP